MRHRPRSASPRRGDRPRRAARRPAAPLLLSHYGANDNYYACGSRRCVDGLPCFCFIFCFLYYSCICLYGLYVIGHSGLIRYGYGTDAVRIRCGHGTDTGRMRCGYDTDTITMRIRYVRIRYGDGTGTVRIRHGYSGFTHSTCTHVCGPLGLPCTHHFLGERSRREQV